MMAHQMLLLTAMAVGIMSILLVTRHTRADEEDGRIEMIRFFCRLDDWLIYMQPFPYRLERMR
ncbi:hypothetical protein RCO48_17630 [Peribacillus frigoritolerans]|nr:hypothetical protein [Peribacillus frigoritolerans]